MVESDCQVAVHAINSAVNIMSPSGTIIMDCRYEATFLYILLSDNGIKTTDYLSRLSSSIPGYSLRMLLLI